MTAEEMSQIKTIEGVYVGALKQMHHPTPLLCKCPPLKYHVISKSAARQYITPQRLRFQLCLQVDNQCNPLQNFSIKFFLTVHMRALLP